MADEEGNNPIVMFEIHFFALFGITDYSEVIASNYLQGWTFYLFKIIFATYMTLTVIVLINLLIAMMSDTYCRSELIKCKLGKLQTLLGYRSSQTLSGSLVWPS